MRISNILRTQECPSFRLSRTFNEDSSFLLVLLSAPTDIINPSNRRVSDANTSCCAADGCTSSSNSNGLKSVSKVLSVTLALTRNSSSPLKKKTSFSANVSSLAERRQTCCGVTGRQCGGNKLLDYLQGF